MTQELQWRFSHFAQKAHERNDDKCGSGHHGALEENTPVPEHLERRQAVGAVVKLAHGLGKECHSERGTYTSCQDAYNCRQR